jgi:hypothetical protein
MNITDQRNSAFLISYEGGGMKNRLVRKYIGKPFLYLVLILFCISLNSLKVKASECYP